MSLEDSSYKDFNVQNMHMMLVHLPQGNVFVTGGEVSVNIFWNFPGSHRITCLQKGNTDGMLLLDW